MKLKKALKILKRHNKWRRGAGIPMENPTQLGIAIDTILETFKPNRIDYNKYPFRPFSELSKKEQKIIKSRTVPVLRKKNPEHITQDTIFFDAEIQDGLHIIGFTNKTVKEEISELKGAELKVYKSLTQEDWERKVYPQATEVINNSSK